MTNLNEIVLQMNDERFNELCESFKFTRADKYFILIKHIRQNQDDENIIIRDLETSLGAYYALRSRLHDKVKAFLLQKISESKTGLYKHVTHLPELLYNTPKKTAISILQKLEADLLKSDMPYELSHVYSVLKKIYIHSPKYFHYSQRFNKTLAYTTSIHKAEELMIDFSKLIASHYVSRSKQLEELVVLIRSEIHNLSNLYASHRLKLYKLFIDISFALWLPDSIAISEDDPVEDMLKEADKILQSCPNDVNYIHLDKIYYFLAFEYYHSLGIHKKAAVYFDSLKENLCSFLLYNFCTFPSKILISKIEHYTALNTPDLLEEEYLVLKKNYVPDPEDLPGYITYNKYKAIICMITGKYVDAINYLAKTCDKINFRDYPHAEIEFKLMLTVCYSMVNGYEMSQQTLKGIMRRINEMEEGVYENAKALAKLLHIQNSPNINSARAQKVIMRQRDKFIEKNKGIYKMFEGIDLSNDFIRKLTKFVKDPAE